MANSPVSLILPQYDIDDAPAAGYYLKGYQAGTTTPITMYTDAAGSSSLAKAALDANGFPITSGNVKFTPHFAEAFDLWLFPDATSADANDTSSAVQVSDSGILLYSVPFIILEVATVTALKAGIFINGVTVTTKEHTSGYGYEGGNHYLIRAVTGATADDGSIIKLDNGTQEAVGQFKYGINPLQFGCAGDGSTNDITKFQAMVSYASTLAAGDKLVECDLVARKYSFESSLDLSNAIFVALLNGSIIANGTWSASPIIDATNATSDTLENLILRNLFIDCNHKSRGILLENTINTKLDQLLVKRAITYHIKAETKNTELVIDSVKVNQYDFGESGYDTIANRTAYGIWTDCADVHVINSTANYCLEPLRATGGNCQYSNCHFYNGATTDGTDNIAVHLEGARGQIFSGCYFDNGIIKITGDSANDEFNHTIDGQLVFSAATGNITIVVELVATAANETAEGLRVNLLSRGLATGFTLRQSTSGGGSWTTPLKAAIRTIDRNGNKNAYGAEVIPDGGASNPGLCFSSESDLNTGWYYNTADQWHFSANGTGIVKLTANGLEAVSAGNGFLGGTSDYLFTTHTTRLRILDGVTVTGSLPTGFAEIYIDTSDGDLKIKFNDGTIKTIVTDT